MSERHGRLLGLDVGRKTIGIAVSDPLGVTSQGVEVWRRRSPEEDLGRLAELISEYEVETVVLGIPLRTDGKPGPEAEHVRAFAVEIADRLSVNVDLWDERFTTKEAERFLIGAGLRRRKRKGVVDMTAATLILDGYMQRRAMRRAALDEKD